MENEMDKQLRMKDFKEFCKVIDAQQHETIVKMYERKYDTKGGNK